MSTRPTEDRPGDGDELLRALMLGERGPDEPEVRARLEADPALRGRWEAERELGRRLDAAGDLEDDVLGELGEGGPAPGEERVEATLAGLRRGRSTPSVRRRWHPFALAAAAALLVSVGWLLGRGGSPEPAGPGSGGPEGPRTILGADEDAPLLEGPAGQVAPDGLLRFRWLYDPEEDWRGRCRVRILVDGVPLPWRDSYGTRISEERWEWRPDEAQRSELVDLARFEWEVEAVFLAEESVYSERSHVSVSR